MCVSVHFSVWQGGPDRRLVHDLAPFIQDLYVAAEFKKPVVTVIERPAIDRIRRVFRDDMAVVKPVVKTRQNGKRKLA
jgi:hypothetical protein